MKKIVLFAIMAFLSGSCCVNPETSRRLKMQKHYVEIDYRAQEFKLYANINLTGGVFNWYEKDTMEPGHKYIVGDSLEIDEGEWVKVIYNNKHRKYLTVSVDENDWGRDRTVLIYGNAFGDSDSVRVVQKGKVN